MTRSKSRNAREAQQQTLSSHDDDLSDAFDGFSGGESIEKDEVEAELERIVFGDDAGFFEDLEQHAGSKATPNLDELGSALSEDEVAGQDDLHGVDDADLFFLDSAPVYSSERKEGRDSSPESRGAAWVDPDDEHVLVSLSSNSRLRKLRVAEDEDQINGKEYIKRLRRQYERLHPRPDWANPSTLKTKPRKAKRSALNGRSSPSEKSSSDSEMSVDGGEQSARPLADLLQNIGGLVGSTTDTTGRKKLRPEVINIQRTKDVGPPQPSSVASLAFHPIHPILLSSGPAATLYLHHISPHPPNPNPLVTSLHIRGVSITTSVFHPTAPARVIFSGRRRYFHAWDLASGKIDKISQIHGHQHEQRSMERFKLSPCGRWTGLVGSQRKGGGNVNVLDANTSQWVAEVRVEGKGGVADFEWWGDGEGLTLTSKGGEAVEWDGRSKRIVARWMDEGAVGTTVIATGGKGGGPKDLGGNRWIAIGSSSGIVNVYDRRGWSRDTIPANPTPTKVFDQLTTPISHLLFSPQGQIMVMASHWKKDALRLIHLPSCTVYKNWPTSSTPLGRITSLAFSPASELLAVANEQGKIRLWEIR